MLLNLKKWFRNQRIKRKINIIFIPLISIPLFILAYASNNVFTNSVIQKTIVNVASESQLIVTRIQESILNAENCANIITVNLNKVITANQALNKDDISNKTLVAQIENQLGMDLLFFPDVEAVVFLDMNGQFYTSNNLMQEGLQTAFHSNIMQQINKTSGENIWFTMEARDFLTTSKGVPVLTLGKKILNINTGDQLGSLILIIKESSFSAIYESAEQEQNKRRNYMIVDSQGQVISSLDKNELLKAPAISAISSIWLNKKSVSNIVKWQGQQFLISSAPFEKLNWKLVSQIPLSILTADTRKISWLIVGLGLFGIVFSFFGAEMLSRIIAKPLIRLTKTMLKVRDGDLKIYFDVNSSDEIGFLSSGFNKMLAQIRDLIDQVGTEQKQKRQYELALIQSQIKPHFLYNTLDLVYVLCSMNRVIEAKDATKALADFYRIALSGGREVISISEELDNVNDYLAIQKIRYTDVFDFSIEMDATILNSQILKLTIQPLVENAIYHGLKPKGSNGMLYITGSCTDQEILITVSDNGVGMEPEIIQGLLLNTQKSDGSHKSFGLFSVNERIKLYYGTEFGVTIHSKLGEGTAVVARLPKHIKGGSENV
jgi:two-component system sensor histidine kinase YesM